MSAESGSAALRAQSNPTPLRIGSLCTGYGGLDMAVERVFGGRLAWVSDVDPGASRILAHHWPAVPNLGDLTTTRWDEVEPVDVVCGGYPCQPFSSAGLRKGTQDERHIWPYIADALRVLRPRYAFFENVANHLRLGFADVLADLARLGFDAEWCLVRASEVGAPHQRQRLFLLATAADAPHLGHERGRDARGRWSGPSHGDIAAADTDRRGLARLAAVDGAQPAVPVPDAVRSGVQPGAAEPDCPTCGCPEGVHDAGGYCAGCASCTDPDLGRPAGDDLGRPDTAAADAARLRHGHARPASERRLAPAPVASRLVAPDGRGSWGRFGPAVARWEAVTGRRAPWATDDRGRLSPLFVEWLMGLPAGHVTAVPDLTRTQQLKALGNGVVPQQAAAALRLLVDRADAAA